MPLFKYKAIKSSGGQEAGTVDAPNQDSAINTLQQKGLIVISVSKTEEISSGKAFRVKLHSRITTKDLILFATQLTTTLQANIPLLKCIEIQIQQTMSRKLKNTLEDIRDNIKQGHSLKDSLARHPNIFGPMWINLIETGETSGQLPSVIEHLKEYLVAAGELRRKTITALIYPAILICVSILAIYIFSVRIIPIFASIFNDFNMPLPQITKIVLNMSNFLRKNIFWTVISTAGIIFLILRYIKTEQGKRIFDIFIFKLPIFGNFILNSYLEKFSSSLSLLLHSGIPILQALDIVGRTSGNKIIEESLKNAYTDVRDGKTFSGSLLKNRIFPPLVVSMCNVGEETGELDKMLENIRNYYRDELNTFVERLGAMLEPIVIVIMGGIVFVLVLAMYLPIFQIALLGRGVR